MKRVLLAVALIALASAAKAAEQMKVDDLRVMCFSTDKEAISGCRFFILGVVEGASFGEGRSTAGGPLCIAPTSSADLVEVVKASMTLDLRAYPQDKDLLAAGFVAAAAMKSFPCKK